MMQMNKTCFKHLWLLGLNSVCSGARGLVAIATTIAKTAVLGNLVLLNKRKWCLKIWPLLWPHQHFSNIKPSPGRPVYSNKNSVCWFTNQDCTVFQCYVTRLRLAITVPGTWMVNYFFFVYRSFCWQHAVSKSQTKMVIVLMCMADLVSFMQEIPQGVIIMLIVQIVYRHAIDISSGQEHSLNITLSYLTDQYEML